MPPHSHLPVLGERDAASIQRIIMGWGRANPASYPWRTATDPWAKLVAEVLLQRTQADRVSPVFTQLIADYPDADSMAAADAEHIAVLMQGLGLRKRSRALVEMACAVVQLGGIPDQYADLIQLPGVGDYTASAWLCFSKGVPGVLVDSNIARWIYRMLGREWCRQGHRAAWVRQAALQIARNAPSARYHYAVLDFTRTICTASPRCNTCPLAARYCAWGRRSRSVSAV